MSLFDRITETEDKPDYFDRNRKWLYPLAGSITLVAASLTLSMWQATPGGEVNLFVPEWLIALFALLGIVMAGFGLAVTDTLSAAIISFALSLPVLLVRGGIARRAKRALLSLPADDQFLSHIKFCML